MVWLGGLLTAGLLAIATYAYAEDVPADERPYVDEACAASFACQDVIIYELVFAGTVVSTWDLDAQECEDMKEAIQKNTGAMSDLKCRPRLVERQKI